MSGANCQDCNGTNGCYRKSKIKTENGKPVYFGQAYHWIANNSLDDHWYIGKDIQGGEYSGLLLYKEITRTFDEPQGVYRSLDYDPAIGTATVKCTSECFLVKPNAKFMRETQGSTIFGNNKL